MPLLSRARGERGFTMVTVVISMFVVMTLSAAALSAAQGDLPAGKHDGDRKIAYAAAEAGLQNFMFHLVDDPNYWAKCTTVSGPVNDVWDGAAARRWASVPGSRARYTIELVPANGSARCLTSTPDATMIDSATGTFRVRVTGQALHADGVSGPRRTLVVNFKRQSLLDFIYFTDKEVLDPSLYRIYSGGYTTDRLTGELDESVTQWGTTRCNRYHGDNPTLGNRQNQQFSGAGGNLATQRTGLKYGTTWYAFSLDCMEIQFASGDAIRGPLHTNDQIWCQNTFPVVKLGRMPTDRVEIASTGETAARPAGYRGCTPYANLGITTALGDAGQLKGKGDGVRPLSMPPSNSTLKRDTEAAYRFVGKTTVVLKADGTMDVTGEREDGTVLTGANVTPPADGVFYVANSPTLACSAYNPNDAYTVPAGCGNLEIQGTYSANLTFTAENDIVIMEDLRRKTGTESLLGLISNNFIRVYHPLSSGPTFTPNISGSTVTSVSRSCTNSGSAPTSVQIDAAIMSLTHSFIVDNYYCGAGLGTLSVNGAIVQYYRGAVGTSAGTGYIKNYTYDDRLKYRSPPKFLDPVQAGWVVKTYNEQVPAR